MELVREWRGVTRGLTAPSTTLLLREWRPGVTGAPMSTLALEKGLDWPRFLYKPHMQPPVQSRVFD